MRRSLILVFLLLLLPLASAKSLHNDWHYTEDTFNIGGVEYYVFHEYGEDSVLLRIDNRSSLLALGKCAEIISRVHCFTEMEANISSDKVKYKDGKPLAALKISIESVGPDISMTRTASETDIELGGTSRITVKVTNKGNRQLDSFTYFDRFPSSLRLLDSNMINNGFTRKGSLAPGKSITFSYTIQANKFTTYSSRATLNHTYQGDTETITSNAINFVVESPYEVTTTVDKDDFLLGEEFVYTIKVKNPSEEELLVKNMELSYPRMDLVTYDGNLSLQGNSLVWGGLLDSGQEISFRVKLKPYRTGKYAVIADASFNYLDLNYDFNTEEEVDVSVKGADTTVYLSPKNLTSGSEVKLTGRIKNNDEFTYRLADVKIEAFGQTFVSTQEEVAQGNTAVAVDKVFVAPEVFETKVYPVTFSGKYLHPGGEIFTFSVKDSITVTPKSKFMNIVIDAPEVAYKGRLAKVRVSIENLLDEDAKFSVRDEITPNFRVEKGEVSKVLTVGRGNLEEAYAYEFRVPQNSRSGEAVVMTHARISGTNVSTEKSVVIPISEKEVSQAEIGEEEEQGPGFFTKLVNGIASFFSRWFG